MRFIGLIPKDSLDATLSNEGLQIKGKSAYNTLNITLEGIGDDATAWGFGFLVRNASSVEFRNFAIMLNPDDCVSLDTKNSHIWVHHMDFFYGNAGSDKDQAKGDGTGPEGRQSVYHDQLLPFLGLGQELALRHEE